jgi:hypothetical protein
MEVSRWMSSANHWITYSATATGQILIDFVICNYHVCYSPISRNIVSLARMKTLVCKNKSQVYVYAT